MSHDLRWYLNRLRAMSVAEVAHRSYRAARFPIDKVRMRTGLYARPSAAMRVHLDHWQGPEPFYFDRALASTPVSPGLRAEAEAICAGKRRVLGLGWIDFPPDGWHYDPHAQDHWPRIDAARVRRAAPARFDPRLTWELNRGHEWVVLARVYASTREPRFLAQLARDLASWRKANPLGIGINWSFAMEAAIRVHSLVWCAGFLRGTANDLFPELATAIYEHTTFVSENRSYFSSANNHAIVELSALIVAALALGGTLRSLHEPALAQLTGELDRQVFADGVSAEIATHYHAFVLEALVLVEHLLRAHGMPAPGLEAVIQRMAEYLRAIRCDDGSLLQQGDNDDGCLLAFLRTQHAEQLLCAAAALGARARRPDPQPPSSCEGAFWLTGGATPARIEAAPARSRRFADSGQVVLRSPRLLASFDAGPFGFGSLAAHAHCDALSIMLAVDGRRILVDRGTYLYNGDVRERERYRAIAAHNTAQIGSLEQATPAGPFLWSRQPTLAVHRCDLTDEGDIVQASHDGFSGWSHRRTLVHSHGVLVIIDEFRGARSPAQVIGRYHFAPELDIVALSRSRFRADHKTSSLAWLVSNAGAAHVISTPHSDTYASSTPARTIELCGSTSGPALVTAMAPADVPQDASIAALAAFAAAQGVPFSARELTCA
ncbi:MAG TPA: alginate lyase family protein [Kofleriaceae bacterium]|nr:alginate lyase family protein [Kofleriaceae bacterium]